MKKYFLITCTIFVGIITTLSGHLASDLDTFLELECTIVPLERHTPHSKKKNHSISRHLRRPEVSSHPLVPYDSASSTNWSGYVAQTSLTHPTNGSVTSVSGEWNVPALARASDTTYCAVWVGIDGFSNGTVEQIGTEHEWYNGAQINYAWFEMYPTGAYELVGFPVNAHDLMGAEVNYVGNNVFQLIIINYSRNTYTIIPSSYTKSSSALRSSAEWIVEAPYYNGVLPLSHFGTLPWNNCSATIQGYTGPINYSRWAEESITMKTVSGVTKALPSALIPGGKGFSVTWEHE